MPKFARPHIPYRGESLPNNKRYEILTSSQRPPTAQVLDGEFNYLIDALNQLLHLIQQTAAGSLPGSSDVSNTYKVLTTDGKGHLSWVRVGHDHLSLQSITTDHLVSEAVTNAKLGDASVTRAKLAGESINSVHIVESAIQTHHIGPSQVTSDKIALSAISCAQVCDQSISTAKIMDQAITSPKIQEGAITTRHISAQNITTALLADEAITAAKIEKAARIPVGTLIPFAGISVPPGWLPCHGQEVSRLAYPDLFAALGITYGSGDGVVTFNLPDLRGRAVFGLVADNKDNRITTASANHVGLGGQGGEEQHTLTPAQLPSHSHDYAPSVYIPSGFCSGSLPRHAGIVWTSGVISSTPSTMEVGGNEPSPNMPPFILLNYLIKC